MKFYFCLEQLDELRGLSKNERRFVVALYGRTQPPTPYSKNLDRAFVGAIIFAMIAGGLAGAFFWRNPDVGCGVGCIIALFFVMCVFYFGNLYLIIPKFRQFLKTGPGKFMLRSIRMPDEAPRELATPPRKAVGEIPGNYRGSDDAPMTKDAKAEAVKKIGYGVARTAEVMELAGESFKQSLRLSNAIEQKSQEASQAIGSLRLGRWRRLGWEIFALQTEACCLFRRGCELSARAETNLGVARYLLAKVERKSEP